MALNLLVMAKKKKKKACLEDIHKLYFPYHTEKKPHSFLMQTLYLSQQTSLMLTQNKYYFIDMLKIRPLH